MICKFIINMSKDRIKQLKEILKIKQIKEGELFYFKNTKNDELNILFDSVYSGKDVYKDGRVIDIYKNYFSLFRLKKDNLQFVCKVFDDSSIALKNLNDILDNYSNTLENDIFITKIITPIKINKINNEELENFKTKYDIKNIIL